MRTWKKIAKKSKSEVVVTPITIPSSAKEIFISVFYSTNYMFTFFVLNNEDITSNRTLRSGTPTNDAYIVLTYANGTLKVTNGGVRINGTEENPYISVYYR